MTTEYLLIISLVLTSYILGTYLKVQSSRDVIDRPLLYNNRNLSVLKILLNWIPIIIAIYFAYKIDLRAIFIVLVIRFGFLAIFNRSLHGFMNKVGI